MGLGLAPLLRRHAARRAGAIWDAETRVLRRLGLARPPAAVQWIATRACDLACLHCYSRAGVRAADELTTDEAKHLVVDELARMGCTSLVLAGGEVLLRRDLPDIVAHAAANGIEWSLQTHGGHVARVRPMLEAHPPAMAAVSLDGTPELHDLFRGRSGSFASALEAISVLKACGVRAVVAGTTVTRDNADSLPDLFDVVVESGADAWGIHLFAPEGRGEGCRELFPTPEQLRRVVAFARRKRLVFDVELGDEWGGAGADDALYRDTPFFCGAGRFTCVVGPGGEVVPCTTTDLAESEGNVRERPLSEIWASGFERFRAPGHGACSDTTECWLQARNGNACARATFGAEVTR